jgi:hypothetical protein
LEIGIFSTYLSSQNIVPEDSRASLKIIIIITPMRHGIDWMKSTEENNSVAVGVFQSKKDPVRD